jgi:hypothetical protein
MSKRMWTGLVVGLLAALALVAVGVGAYHAGQDHDVAVATVPGAAGEVVRVVDYGHWRGGPPFGFLIPLLVIGLIVVLVAGRRRASWGPQGGPYGPGGWGACGPGGKEAMLADWHRRVHGEAGVEPPTSGQAPPGTA